eukprot:15228334-Heterocapsa_arctica.AAC.1
MNDGFATTLGIGVTITSKAGAYWFGPAPPYVSICGQRREQLKDLVAVVAGQAAAVAILLSGA